MHVSVYLQLAIGIVALIVMVISFLSMAGIVGSHRIGAEDYDNPAFKWFIGALVVVIINILIAIAMQLWDLNGDRLVLMVPYAVIVVSVLYILGADHWLMAAWQKMAAKVQQAGTPAAKPWWMSKTILFNTLVGVLLLAEAKVSSLQGILPDSKYQIVAFALPIINMLLRVITSRGLSFTATPPQGATAP